MLSLGICHRSFAKVYGIRSTNHRTIAKRCTCQPYDLFAHKDPLCIRILYISLSSTSMFLMAFEIQSWFAVLCSKVWSPNCSPFASMPYNDHTECLLYHLRDWPIAYTVCGCLIWTSLPQKLEGFHGLNWVPHFGDLPIVWSCRADQKHFIIIEIYMMKSFGAVQSSCSFEKRPCFRGRTVLDGYFQYISLDWLLNERKTHRRTARQANC